MKRRLIEFTVTVAILPLWTLDEVVMAVRDLCNWLSCFLNRQREALHEWERRN